MALVKSIKDKTPKIHKTTHIAENATIVGDVIIEQNCSIWYNAVLRGDVNSIHIHSGVNIQDGAIIHCTYQKTDTIIGKNTSIGHNAIIHGCTIHENVLIGMGAIVMDNAIIESNSIVAAGAIVTEGTIVKSGEIFAGIPAKKIKDIDKNLVHKKNTTTSEKYLKYAKWQLPNN